MLIGVIFLRLWNNCYFLKFSVSFWKIWENCFPGTISNIAPIEKIKGMTLLRLKIITIEKNENFCSGKIFKKVKFCKIKQHLKKKFPRDMLLHIFQGQFKESIILLKISFETFTFYWIRLIYKPKMISKDRRVPE